MALPFVVGAASRLVSAALAGLLIGALSIAPRQ